MVEEGKGGSCNFYLEVYGEYLPYSIYPIYDIFHERQRKHNFVEWPKSTHALFTDINLPQFPITRYENLYMSFACYVSYVRNKLTLCHTEENYTPTWIFLGKTFDY